MKKQKKQMISLLILLLVIVGALVGLRAYNSAQANKPAEVEGEIIVEMEYADTEMLTYSYEGVEYSFERVDDVWYVKDDHSQNVKQYRIKAMLTGVAPLVATQIIENVTDYSQYGLDEPERVIIFGDDMEQFAMTVGDYNSMSSAYYVRVNDSAEVYVVDSASITRFNYTVDDLVDAAEEETADADTETETATDGTEVAAENADAEVDGAAQ